MFSESVASERKMFSRQQLITELTRLAAIDSPPLEIVAFGQWDFESPCSEQCIWAFRGTKQDFTNGLLFWVKTLQTQDWAGRESYFASYAASARYEPISEAVFARLVAEYGGSLRKPLPEFLRRLSDFQTGLQMYSEWNDVAVVAELTEAFVAFYWSTTA